MPHFEFVESDRIEHKGFILTRIRATADLPHHKVKIGDLGGYIRSVHNLKDSAWVADNAKVYGHARIECRALVCGDAEVFGNAVVSGDSCVSDFATVCNKARILNNAKVLEHAVIKNFATVRSFAKIGGHAVIEGNACVEDHAKIQGNTHVFGRACIRGDTVVSAGEFAGYAYVINNDMITVGRWRPNKKAPTKQITICHASSVMSLRNADVSVMYDGKVIVSENIMINLPPSVDDEARRELEQMVETAKEKVRRAIKKLHAGTEENR